MRCSTFPALGPPLFGPEVRADSIKLTDHRLLDNMKGNKRDASTLGVDLSLIARQFVKYRGLPWGQLPYIPHSFARSLFAKSLDVGFAYARSRVLYMRHILAMFGPPILEDFSAEVFDDFVKIRSRVWEETSNGGYCVGGFPKPNELILYSLIRSQHPSLVIETGVAAGVSSYFILKALERNHFGRLTSIDLPNQSNPRGYLNRDGKVDGVYTPADRGVGWLVPHSLRHRWSLIMGDSLTELQRLDQNPDIFYHDSDHSETVMRQEFEWALQHHARFLLTDDADWNAAWSMFKPPEAAVHVTLGGLGFALLVDPTRDAPRHGSPGRQSIGT